MNASDMLLVLLSGFLFSGIAITGKPGAGDKPIYRETLIDSSSFASYAAFEAKWNYLYPWGSDHNGSARMIGGPGKHNHIALMDSGVLHLKAEYIQHDEGRSNKDPFLPIKYHSGAIHAKHQVTVSDEWPMYEVSGYFKAPTSKGTWPAFWLTAVRGWPPESDILEFKGDDTNWQNTFITPRQITTTKISVPDAATVWHHYKALLIRVNHTDIDIHYFIDDQLTGVHRANFMNQPLWIIINLQMEGSSGAPGPAGATEYYVKNIVVRRSREVE